MWLRLFLFFGCFTFLAFGQKEANATQAYAVYGKITDEQSLPIPQVKVSFLGQSNSVLTNAEGSFRLVFPQGLTKIDLVFSKEGFRTLTIPLDVPQGEDLIFQNWMMKREVTPIEDWPTYDLQDLEFFGDDFDRTQIGSVLHAQRNPFLNIAAFQFGNTFFRLRGLGSRHNVVTLNGIPMNSFDNGRPLWSQWGGLNDFTNRTQQFQYGITATENNFGGLLGHTQITLKPTSLLKGSKISQAFSNTTYQYRTMISRVGSFGEKGWHYAFLFSSRVGKQGYVEGTPYRALSGLLSLEKSWNSKHHSWITAIFTPNRRGKSAPMTEEVFDLKGRQYNPYWGEQKGKIRNAREVELVLPMIFFNHQWQIRKGAELQLNLAYQWGKQSSGRIYYNGHRIKDNFITGGGKNPDPTYYQRLPSYFLRDPDRVNYKSAYLAQKSLLEQGQLDWGALYQANQNQEDGSAIYALYQDVKAPKRLTAAVQFNREWDSGFELGLNAIYIRDNSNFYATPKDLLDAKHLWDLNPYASNFESAPNDLNQPKRTVVAGEPFLYHYDLKTDVLELAAQAEYNKRGVMSFLALKLNQQDYLRAGKFKNGSYPDNSFGAGEAQSFLGWHLKGGIQYAFTGRHRLALNGGFYNQPPPQQNVYANPRENHLIVPNTSLDKHIVFDVGYHFQTSRVEFKVTGYRIQQKDLSEVSFYFADGVGGDQALFVQEMLTGVEKSNTGVEFYAVYRPVPELKLTGAVAFGQHLTDNNPELFLSTVIDEETIDLGFEQGLKSFGSSKLKGYALSGGPQRAFSLGMDYEDPNYWRLGIYGNYFSHAFLDPNPLLRTQNFLTDYDGLPFSDYDPEQAKVLLQQEQFPAYFLLNATGGKSWLLGKKYFGFFISIQNLLNTTYKTGGFQQGRNANYPGLLEDQSRELPLFGPKYWWGRGTTYFASIYLRF